MNGVEFKRSLRALGLTYAEFGALIDVAERTVQAWAKEGAGRQTALLLRLLLDLDPEARRKYMRAATPHERGVRFVQLGRYDR